MSMIPTEILKCLVLLVQSLAQTNLVVIGMWYAPVDKLEKQQIKDFMRGICPTMGPRQLEAVVKRWSFHITNYADTLAVSILMEYNTNIYIKLPEMRLRVQVGE